MKNKAFTLAEMLVVLAVMGVVIMVTIPALLSARPNQNKLLFKKAYFDAERTISDLINDENFYPEPVLNLAVNAANANTSCATRTTSDLCDTTQVTAGGQVYGDNVVSGSVAARSKFCQLFAEKLNITTPQAQVCQNTGFSNPTGDPFASSESFITANGVAWYMPIAAPVFNGWMRIGIDVNGPSKDVDCRCTANAVANQTEAAVDTACAACEKPDRFIVEVRSDGKMRVVGAKEVQYLSDVGVR